MKDLQISNTLFFAGLLVLGDTFLLYPGALAITVAFPCCVFSALSPRSTYRLRRAGIYFTAIVVIYTLNAGQNCIARHRAKRLAAALQAYHQTNQSYPAHLSELVPQYIDHIPRAKATIMDVFGPFTYGRTDENAFLGYISLPPFWKCVYSLESQQWHCFD